MSPVGAILGSAAVTIGRGVAAAAGDGLSFASELLKAVGGERPAKQAAPAENPLTARIEALRERLRRYLSAAGIELSQPVELTSDGLGGIAVGAHPQQAAIEAALNSDVLLERDFQQLVQDTSDAAGAEASLAIVVAPRAPSIPSAG